MTLYPCRFREVRIAHRLIEILMRCCGKKNVNGVGIKDWGVKMTIHRDDFVVKSERDDA